jgi:hypothetical protein
MPSSWYVLVVFQDYAQMLSGWGEDGREKNSWGKVWWSKENEKSMRKGCPPQQDE